MEKNKKIIIVSIAGFVLVIVIGWFYFISVLNEKEHVFNQNDAEHVKREQALQNQMDELTVELTNKDLTIKTLEDEKKVYDQEMAELKDYILYLNSSDTHVQMLIEQKYGITDYAIIAQDLFLKPSTITQDAVLGGTMAFYNVKILSDKWAFAEFEDGHIMGFGLYEYTISENGLITWSVIQDYIFD